MNTVEPTLPVSEAIAGVARDGAGVGPSRSAAAPAPTATQPGATLPPSPPALAPADPIPRLFGDYELLELIGQGGMGVVYKARQRSLDRIVAVKMMLGGRLATPEDISRFYTEARAAGQIAHPHVVSIYQVGEIDGRHYFSMDYVEGTDLSRLCKDGPLESRRAAGYLKTVAEAVHAAHEQGILHRDLKPANILLGLEDRPYVTDFGLAKHPRVAGGLTTTGKAMGTPSYMPPEQAAGRWDQVTRASDVYALGAILYVMLTGQPPFATPTEVDTLLDVMHREPMSPKTLNPAADDDLTTICLKCLRKNAAGRYATAKELADDLERYLRGEPILARPQSRWQRMLQWTLEIPLVAALAGRPLPRPTRRHRRAQAALLLGTVALAVLAAAGLATRGWSGSWMPSRILLAAGRPGGLYYEFSGQIAHALRRATGRSVTVETTTGSGENRRRVEGHQVHLAWLQAGALRGDEVRVVAPAYYEYVHLIVRADRSCATIADLAGKRVSLGERSSGSRLTAEALLRHFQLADLIVPDESNITQFQTNAALDAAITTVGLGSRELQELLGGGQFRLLPIVPAPTFADRTMEAGRIPRHAYPAAISDPAGIPTLKTPAFLVTYPGAADRLVETTLEALYSLRHPELIPREAAATWTFLPWHHAARRYYETLSPR